MAFLAGLPPLLSGLLFGGVGLASSLAKKKPAPVAAAPARRDDMQGDAIRADALRMRRGAAADMITGTRGAEAAAGSVGRLVVGS